VHEQRTDQRRAQNAAAAVFGDPVIVDTHAHANDPSFDTDRGPMLARAAAAGVGRILTVGCDLADSGRALAVASEHGLDWSVGVHPHEAKGAPSDLAGAFDALISGADVAPVAVGETGLDYYYDHSPRDVQRAVMRAQVRYARERALPVIFHHRDAFDDFVAVLRDEWAAGMRGVVHCFTGDAVQAHTLVDQFGLVLGIGGVVTFKNADALRDAVTKVGLERIVLETDCPYLAPVPHRGKRNEPSFITATAATVARLFNLSDRDVADRTTATATELFRRSGRVGDPHLPPEVRRD
jgi:TatD DNase family protein